MAELPGDRILSKMASLNEASADKQEDLYRKRVELPRAETLARDLRNLSAPEIAYLHGKQAVVDQANANAQDFYDTQAESTYRSLGEIAGDSGLSVVRTTADLIGGAYNLSNMLGPGRLIEETEQLINPEGQTSNDRISQGFSNIDSWLGRQMSSGSQLNEDVVNRRIAQRTAESALQAEMEGGGLGANLRRIGRDISAGFGETIDNPTVLGNVAVGQLPTLLLSAPAKGAISVEQISARALANLTERVGAAEARNVLANSSSRAAREALGEAQEQLFARNMGAVVGATEGGSAGMQAANEVRSMSHKDLFESSEDYRQMIAEGRTPEEAKSALEDRANIVATLTAGPLAAAAGRLASRFEFSPLTAPGRNSVERLVGAAGTVGQEMGEELVQGGASQFATNLGVAVGADDDRSLVEGVGSAAGQGAAAAGAFSGAFQGPSIARNAAGIPLSAAARYLSSRAQAREAENVEQQRAAAVQESNALNEVAASIPEAVTQIVPAANPIRDYLTAVNGADPVSGDTYFNVLTQTRENLRASDGSNPQADLANLAMLRNATQNVRGLYEQLSASGKYSTEALEPIYKAAFDEDVDAQLKKLDNISDDVLAEMYDSIGGEDAARSNAAVEITKSLLSLAPDRITADGAQKVLAQNIPLTPIERSQLEAVVIENQANQDYDTKISEIKERSGLKTIADVRNDIRETGFAGDTSGERKSLRQYYRDVMTAMSEGRIDDAKESLSMLGKFANHLIDRAGLFDDGALRAVQTNKTAEVTGTKTLDKKSGKVVDKPFLLHPNSEASMANVDVVHADAEVAGKTFNVLAQKFPELGASVLQLPAATYQGVTDAAGARAQRMSNQVNNAARLRVNAIARVVDGETTIVPDESRPFRSRQRKPRIFREDGSQLSDREVKTLIGGKTPRAPAKKAVKANRKQPIKKSKLTQALEAAIAPKPTVEEVIVQKAAEAKKVVKGNFKKASEVVAKIKDGVAALRHSSNGDEHTIEAFIDGQAVGTLTYDIETDTALEVDIEPEFRRRGLAAAMYRFAAERGNFLVGKNEMHSFLEDGVQLRTNMDITKVELSDMTEEMRSMLPEVTISPEMQALIDQANALEAAASKPTVQTRFPELMPSTPSEDPEQAIRGTNWLNEGFKISEKSRGLFARFENPYQAFRDAIAKGVEGIKDLYAEGERVIVSGFEEHKALLNFTVFAEDLLNKLNANLQNATASRTSGKDTLLNRMVNNPDFFAWSLNDSNSLYAARWGKDKDGKNTIQYADKIGMGMAMTGVKWAIDSFNNPSMMTREAVGKLLGKEENDVTDAEFASLSQLGTYAPLAQSAIADKLMNTLGLQRDSAVSVSYTDGIPKALAGDVLNALISQGVVTVNTRRLHVEAKALLPDNADFAAIRKAGGTVVDLNFLQFNRDESPIRWDRNEPLSIAPLKNMMRDNPRFLDRIMEPDQADLPSIGEPIKMVASKIAGSNQKIAPMQRRAMSLEQKNPFFVNESFMQIMQIFGKDLYTQLLGYNADNLDSYNKIDRLRIKGVNEGLVRSWDNTMEHYNAVGKYALAAGVPSSEVPTYYGFRMVTNGRVMMNGFGPQSDKTSREALTRNMEKLDLTNADHMKGFWLAIAQALDIKTETRPNDVVIAEVKELVTTGRLQPAIEMLMEARMNIEFDSANELADLIRNSGVPVTARMLNALDHVARLNLLPEDATQFDSSIAFELDGKTNGPINALAQFGIASFTGSTISQLAMGGYFLNRDDAPTLNTETAKIKQEQGAADLYGKVANTAQGMMPKMLAAAKKREGFKENARAVWYAGLAAVADVGLIKINNRDGDWSNLTFERKFAKHATMAPIYGSGVNSIIDNLASQVMENFYAEISKAAQENRPLSNELQLQMNVLMGGLSYLNPKTNKYARRPVKMPAVNNVDNYLELEFSKENFEALSANLKLGIGGALGKATMEVNAPTIKVMKLIQAASQLEYLAVSQRYNKAYEELRLQRVEEGKLLKNQALSRADEAALQREFKEFTPVFQLAHTDNISTDYGLDMLSTSRTGKLMVDGREVTTATIKGNFSAHIDVRKFEEPGVRAAPLYNIALGDSTMMMEYFQKMRRALNVFDGLEVNPSDVTTAAHEINEAVRKSWAFDAIGSVAQSFERVRQGGLEMTPGEIEDFVAMLDRAGWMTLETPTNTAELLDMMSSMLDYTATKIQATKQAMGELSASIDQMSGGMNPVVIQGKTVADPVAFVQQRSIEILQAKKPVPKVQGNVDAFKASVRKYGKNKEGFTTLNRSEVQRVLSDYNFGPVGNFLVKQMRGLMPESLSIYIGDQAAPIIQLQHELFDGAMLREDGTLWQGASKGNVVIMSQFSPETLLHELVHVTTLGLIQKFYADPQSMTEDQRAAASALDVLMEQFRVLDTTTMRLDDVDVVAAVKETIEEHLANGDRASAVNEFMAWALTNERLNDVLKKRTLPQKIRDMIGRVLTSVGKLLGMGTKESTQNYLASVLSNFSALTRAAQAVEPTTSPVLAQNMPGGQTNLHELHLDQLSERYGAVIAQYENSNDVQSSRDVWEGARDAAQLVIDFKNAGFSFSPKEEMVFSQIQVLTSTGAALNPRAMNALQDIYTEAMKQITPDTFLPSAGMPTSVQQSIAQAKYDALVGTSNQKNRNGRSNLLGNFVALAAVDKDFRAKLQGMKMPKGEMKGADFDQTIRVNTTNLFDWLANAGLGTNGQDFQTALDKLTAALVAVKSNAAANMIETAMMPVLEVQNKVKQGFNRIGTMARSQLEANQQAGRNSKVDQAINAILIGIDAITTETGAKALGDVVISLSNNMPAALEPIAELMREFVGTTDSTHAITEKLNQVKYLVSRVRQRLRDETPQTVAGWFQTPPTDEQWASLHLSLGRTDIQSLLGQYSLDQIRTFLTDPAALQQATKGLAAQLDQYREGAAYKLAAEALGRYVVLQENTSHMLYRNAEAIAALPGTGVKISKAQQDAAAPILDALVSLHALAHVPDADRAQAAALFDSEGDAMGRLVTYLATLNRRERNKDGALTQRFNQWKGWVPQASDPRRSLILASDADRAKLESQGYTRVGYYASDTTDPAKRLFYYASTTAGAATYNQGALQTAEQSYRGVDFKNGRTLTPNTSTVLTSPQTVQKITRMKLTGNGGSSLIPVFDNAGKIVAYERVLDPKMVQKHLKFAPNLAQSLGMWEGRIAEEALARQFNSTVVDTLKDMWDSAKDKNEFVSINNATDNKTKQVWEMIPRDTQEQMLRVFGDDVMVRKDVVNNALGYRSASVSDIFTKETDLPNDVRRAMEEAAIILFLGDRGKAYKYLLMGERVWQGLVSTAKDWIVVRSLVVGLRNGMANQFQLLQNGVPVTKLLSAQSQKVSEVNTYLKYEKRLTQIGVELASNRDPALRVQLEREVKSIQDAQSRMSIAPLIRAGELPAIAEGLSETDEFTILSDFTGWMEGKMKAVPEPLTLAGKYAVIAKDTAIYQGLNRMIQYGDFVAKATLFDHLKSQGKTEAEALRQVSDDFVNYNLLPGRTRTYLESMGLTWFLNYKIRIQKIMFRAIRNNPLAFLMWGTAANAVGAESLFDANAAAIHWDPAFGPGQFFRAHDVLAWNQLID